MNQFGTFSPTFDVGHGITQVDADIMEVGRVASAVYTAQARFEEERALFGRIWLNVARVEEVAKPNDWVVREIHCRSTSVLIVRGRDGGLNAFHNVCAHRGMKLVCGWWMHRFWPVAPDKTYWEAAWYFRKPVGLREKFAMEYSLAFNRDTLVEDSNALRKQQTMLASGALPFIQFGEQEVGCRHLAAVTSAALREPA